MIKKVDLNNNKERILAPLLLIAYNRPDHFYFSLEALSKNSLSKQTNLYISIDGPRNKEDEESQKLIFEHAKIAKNFFKNVLILKNTYNKGLAANITDSISKVLETNDKIIVLEDDLITSEVFLGYMNDALDYYQFKKNVWHINGHNEVNNIDKKDEVFLWRFMNCWGWATWKDRWINYEKNPKKLINLFDKKMIFRFNLDGAGIFWDQVIQNANGEKNTWAIFWYATIFINNGLCVSPWFSYVRNIGFDGSGTNCGSRKAKNKDLIINKFGKFKGVDKFTENQKAFKIMRSTYRGIFKSFLIKKTIKNFLGNYIYETIKKFYKKRNLLFKKIFFN